MQPSQTRDQKIRLIGKYASLLSLIEVALGSLLHTFHVPFSGNFLSLNQGLLLCRASLEGGGDLPYAVSNVAAMLKSLAPAGRKLGPMLSLSMQGLLFTVGTRLFGVNLLGLSLGMVLLSLWTFLQPVVTYYLFFGNELVRAFEYLFEKTLPYHGLAPSDLGWLIASLVAAKALAAAALAFVAWKWGGGFQDRLLELAKSRGARPLRDEEKTVPFLLALKDLLHPLFLASFMATALFLAFSEHGSAERFWILLRPLAIGFLFFYFSRTLSIEAGLKRLHGTRWEGFAKGCEHALHELYGLQRDTNR